jgi:hypothetical protein
MTTKLIYNASAQKKAVDTALNFLKENIAPEIIARCCSLPIDEVNRLAMELKKEAVQV